jgi:multisubunit Na+/H+ antiporter MnhE subunit
MPRPAQIPNSRDVKSRAWAWLFFWAIAFALWHLYAGKIGAHEAIAGAIGATVTAFASMVVLEKHIAPARAQFRSLAQAWRLPKYVVVGTWEIVSVLARQIFRGEQAPSLFFTVPFDAQGDDDESALRRALAVAYTCATPNFVILGIDRRRGLLVFHQLRESAVPEMTRRLGARG